MKSTSFALILIGFIALGTGCGKQEAPAPAAPASAAATTPAPTPDKVAVDAPKAAVDTLAAEKAAADKLAADALAAEKSAADKLAADKAAAEKAVGAKQSTVAAGAAKIQALIDSATALAGENKWGEVMKIISDLSGQQLTPAQQSAVDGLKAEATKVAQAALSKKATSEAGNAVGGLLQPKK